MKKYETAYNSQIPGGKVMRCVGKAKAEKDGKCRIVGGDRVNLVNKVSTNANRIQFTFIYISE